LEYTGEKQMTTKAKRAPAPTPDALPARFTLNTQAFAGMTAATLKMPYSEPLWRFTKWLEGYFERVPQSRRDENGRTIRPQPPYRLLNDVLTACAPTIVHGFEWYQKSQNDKGRRMLVVGKPSLDEAGLAYPSEDEIADVMRLWLKQWGERTWLRNIIQGEGKLHWEAVCTSLSQPPDTHWETDISPHVLLEKDDGLAYEVIPSLIATLLHETEACIGPHQHIVRWRRMQEANKRYCVVSHPIPVEFLDKNDRTGSDERKSGYFSYKIEFALQTQAGREQPWLYLSLHCMRYADMPLSYNTRRNEVTVLVGANQARLQNWKVDTTLVRLKATANANPKNRDKVMWLEDLPPMLAELKARPLAKPGDLYENPCLYWRNTSESRSADEYYVLHTEGYRYKGNKTHPVLTGFSLLERAEVLGSLCEGALRNVITPDAAMRADVRRFEDHNKPTALHTFADLTPSISLENLSNEEKNSSTVERDALRLARIAVRDTKLQQQRQRNQPVITRALHRATRGKMLAIACFHREADTLDVLIAALRKTFQLNDLDAWPSQLIVLTPLIPTPELVQPLEEIGNMRRKDDEVARWRDRKIAEWQALLQDTFGDYLTRSDIVCSAIVELDKHTHTENRVTKITPDRRSIHSVIREACVRQGVLSQMIVTPDKLFGLPKRDSGTKGKAQQTVQDITTRQIGLIYDQLTDLYRYIGLDAFGMEFSASLDVIALSFCTTVTGVRYCLATRLRADGTVDILLPEPDANWIPYIEAGPHLGKIFAQARRSVVAGKIQDAPYNSPSKQSKARLTLNDISRFVESMLTRRLERPTLVVVEAEKWRSMRDNGGNWWQLQNNCFVDYQNCLVFGNRYKVEEHRHYDRIKADPMSTHGHLLGIVRLRADETPQYVTNRSDWQFDDNMLMRNYFALTGFIDQTTTEVFHYFSIGQLPAGAGQPQQKKTLSDPFKIVSGRKSGGGIAYRHPPMIEMVPFFVHPDLASEDGKAVLCRIPHYLRFSPAWAMGNLDSPYPLHLGDVLIKDQLCILGLGDD
jgi:hypothetical protein